jgi:hypothetical protein
MRRAPLALLAASLLLTAAPARAADNPLQLVATTRIDTRLSELTFRTPAVAGETHVRVLLPSTYDDSGKTRYPVLYLLHGATLDRDGRLQLVVPLSARPVRVDVALAKVHKAKAKRRMHA